MAVNTVTKLGLTTSALVIGYATYLILKDKFKTKLRDAVDVLDYLTIKIINTEEECKEVVNELRRKCETHRAIGFDCEWVTDGGKRHPVALMQLSSYDGLCGLFRLNNLKTIPLCLKDLLEDSTVYKVGVAPLDDAQYLRKDYGIDLKSTLDLRHIAQVCGYVPDGLASLSKQLLSIILDKSWRVRCSDWEADSLTDRQMHYAAADAHVAIKIFVRMMLQLDNQGFMGFCNKKNVVWNDLDNTQCLKFADLHFKASKRDPGTKKNSLKKPGKLKSDTDIVTKRYPHATRSKPLYHNCFLQAPDGELLCTCDNKKALWYVEKELADVIVEDPLTVRLRFEPAGRSVGDVGKYYQLQKVNQCVVCGSSQSYIRKNVVPREYRKYFPEIMKDHSSHDVVLLCVDCHQRSNMLDRDVRERLAGRCHAPISAYGNSKYIEDVDVKKVRSAGNALLHQARRHQLPAARRTELEEIILKHYPEQDEITEQLLRDASELVVVYENADYESHGNKVVEHFMANEGLLRLEELWREHFLTGMRPLYMPPLWSLKHNEERLRVRFNEGRLSLEELKMLGLTHWLIQNKSTK